MQPGQSLPYMNLSRQVQSLDQTVQMLIQYQRLLYIELLQIKKKLGMDENAETNYAAPSQTHHQQQQQAPAPRVSSSRSSAPVASSSSGAASFSGRPEDLDISAIQRALGMSGVKN
jgi:hypothetical protein